MSEERKRIISCITKIPLISWYCKRHGEAEYSIERAGRPICLKDALMK
ncbi:MAG: hypothetical protein KAI43_01295 [Candidatus Aureabacteria bacterium]|nr:hypothetical protein [Candidatus Auribacterota bacterium]